MPRKPTSVEPKTSMVLFLSLDDRALLEAVAAHTKETYQATIRTALRTYAASVLPKEAGEIEEIEEIEEVEA